MTWRVSPHSDYQRPWSVDGWQTIALTIIRANATCFGAAIHKPGGWVWI